MYLEQLNFLIEIQEAPKLKSGKVIIRPRIELTSDLTKTLSNVKLVKGSQFELFSISEKYYTFLCDGIFYSVYKDDCKLNEVSICIKANWCCCNESDLTKHYWQNFIPTKWRLQYDELEQKTPNRALLIEGHCRKCGGYMCSGTALSSSSNNMELINDIWFSFERFRPYALKFKATSNGYETFGNCNEEISKFYNDFESYSLNKKQSIFKGIFKDKDLNLVSKFLGGKL